MDRQEAYDKLKPYGYTYEELTNVPDDELAEMVLQIV